MIILTFVVGFLRIYILLLSQPSSSFILSIHLLASSILLVFLQTLVPEPTLAPDGRLARLEGRGGGPLGSRPGVSLVEPGSAYGNQGPGCPMAGHRSARATPGKLFYIEYRP